MKKICILFLVVALSATCFFFFFKGGSKDHADPASFVSEDAFVSYTQKDLGRVLEDFKNSRLGKTVAHIDLVKMAEDMGLPEETLSLIKTWREETVNFLDSSVFKEIFNNEFTVALFPIPASGLENPAGSIEEHLLVITKPEHGTQLINLLTSGFLKALNQTSVSYGGRTVKLFHLEKGRVLAAAAVQDHIVIAFDERIIRDSLDCYDKKKRSLSDNEGFQKLRAMFEAPLSFSYINMESLHKQMEILVENADRHQKDLLSDAWRKWSGLQAMGYGVWRETDRIRDKGVIVLDGAKLDPALRNFYATPPEKNPSLALVPRDVLAYYWTNTMDFPAYWNMYLQGSGFSGQKREAVREGTKRQFGMDMETILGMLDRQCGLMLQDGVGKRFLPVPDFSFFVRLRDSGGLGELARNFLKNNALQVQTKEYKGVDITMLTAFAQGGMTPVYAIHDQYLIVASSMGMIEQILDTVKEGHGLADSPRFQKVSAGLLDENNSVGYIRTGDLMHTVKGMVGWGRAIVAIQDRRNAKNAEIVIDRLINPVLDGLSMYSDFGLHSRISPHQVLIESTTLIEK